MALEQVKSESYMKSQRVGKGMIATEARLEVVSGGDVVHIPAEEKQQTGLDRDLPTAVRGF